MIKHKYFVPAVLVLVGAGILAAGVMAGMGWSRNEEASDASKYSAVNMTTGEVYFGKLEWFPRPVLRGAWALQRYTDPDGTPQVRVVQVTKAFWMPVADLHLNPANIISWSRLRNDSELVRFLENPDEAQLPPPGGIVPGAPENQPNVPAGE